MFRKSRKWRKPKLFSRVRELPGSESLLEVQPLESIIIEPVLPAQIPIPNDALLEVFDNLDVIDAMSFSLTSKFNQTVAKSYFNNDEIFRLLRHFYNLENRSCALADFKVFIISYKFCDKAQQENEIFRKVMFFVTLLLLTFSGLAIWQVIGLVGDRDSINESKSDLQVACNNPDEKLCNKEEIFYMDSMQCDPDKITNNDIVKLCKNIIASTADAGDHRLKVHLFILAQFLVCILSFVIAQCKHKLFKSFINDDSYVTFADLKNQFGEFHRNNSRFTNKEEMLETIVLNESIPLEKKYKISEINSKMIYRKDWLFSFLITLAREIKGKISEEATKHPAYKNIYLNNPYTFPSLLFKNSSQAAETKQLNTVSPLQRQLFTIGRL